MTLGCEVARVELVKITKRIQHSPANLGIQSQKGRSSPGDSGRRRDPSSCRMFTRFILANVH